MERLYRELLAKVLLYGTEVPDRTGTGTRSLIGKRLYGNIASGTLPVLTGKYVHFPAVATELLWFLRGDTNIRWLQEHGVSIWNEWADENGDLGPVYGHQWRAAGPDWAVDQVGSIVDALAPGGDWFSRRLLVDAWQVADLHKMRLPPCHMVWQVFVREYKNTRHLSMVTYQRSADLFLGVPFNMASYGLLVQLLCMWANASHAEAGTGVTYLPGSLTMNFGDAHIYENHLDQVRQYLDQPVLESPGVKIREHSFDELESLVPSDIVLVDYRHGPRIKAPVAV